MMKIEPTSKTLPIPGSSFADAETVKVTAGDEREAYLWFSLVPRLVHPVKVTIVETLLYMEQPMSASQIAALLDHRDYYVALLSYHLKALEEAGVVERVASSQVRGAEEHFFDLPNNRTS